MIDDAELLSGSMLRFLRSIAERGKFPFGLVFAGEDNFIENAVSKEPGFEHFTSGSVIKLEDFNLKQTTYALTHPLLNSDLKWKEDAVLLLHRFSRGNPYNTMRIAHEAFWNLDKRKIFTLTIVRKATKASLPHFFYDKTMILKPSRQDTFSIEEPEQPTIMIESSMIGSSGKSYFIERLLGEGGLSYVFLARTKNDTNTKVIVKVPRFFGDGSDYFRIERLKFEASILKTMNHRNIVRFIDTINHGRTLKLVLEYLIGQTIKESFLRHPSIKESIKIISELLDTVDYLHSMGIVHGDLKPDSIILTLNRGPVLFDFGTAIYYQENQPSRLDRCLKDRPSVDKTFDILGTPAWSAPEQFSSSGITTPVSDIYAIGGILYFMLTGRAPYKYKRDDGQVTRTPSEINPSIPMDLSRIVMIALEPNPAQRFNDTKEMLNALKPFL